MSSALYILGIRKINSNQIFIIMRYNGCDGKAPGVKRYNEGENEQPGNDRHLISIIG